ncbi:hypothetical protein P5G61_30330, partial [Paenibacillus sp. F6_3S_P_1C]
GVAEWQTRSTQNRVGNRGGSSPLAGIQASKSSLDAKSNELFYLQILFGLWFVEVKGIIFVYVLTHSTNKYIVDM